MLKEAIRTTFRQRNTDIEKRKNIYEDKFKSDEQLQKYWAAFLDRNKLSTENSFANIVDKLKFFIEPILF